MGKFVLPICFSPADKLLMCFPWGSTVNLGNVIGNFFVAWWFIWWMGRRLAFIFGTIVLLVGVALQAAAVAYAMIVIGRIVSGIGTAM